MTPSALHTELDEEEKVGKLSELLFFSLFIYRDLQVPYLGTLL